MSFRYVLCLFSCCLTYFNTVAQDLDNKVFIIQSNGKKAKGKVIQVNYEDLGKNGAKIQLWDNMETPNQMWKFEAIGEGLDRYYIINQSQKAGKYKYLEAAWTTLGLDGGKVQLWEYNGDSNVRYGANQVWQVTRRRDSAFYIISAHPKSKGKVLEADSFTQRSNGGKIHLFFNAEKPNQMWNLIEKK